MKLLSTTGNKMKSILLGAIFMLFSNVAVAEDVFEIVTTKFKEEVPLAEQKKEMAKLNDIVKQYEGFKSRDYYYSPGNGRWFDFVVWSDLDLAKKASEQAMKNPTAGAIFAKMDENTMIFSYYEKVGGVKK